MTVTTAQQRLFDAARKGDKATIRSLVFDENVFFEARDEQGRTAFNIATQFGHADAAQTILAARESRYLRDLGMLSPHVEDTVHQDKSKVA